MSELTRQERFSMSRQFAKELVADSIITDAAAQFLALMIEEIHNTKIAPLQAELKRRTTLSAAMELPEVRAIVEARRAHIDAVDAYNAKINLVNWIYWPKTINRRKLERMIPHFVD